MKNGRIALLILIVLWSSACYAQKPRSNISGDSLLSTTWGGTSPLNLYAPNGDPLGCHAVAFAQVLFYHRLNPQGEIHYTCSNGIEISEDFDDSTPQWDRFALDQKNLSVRWRATRETAAYIYAVASIIRKDFGKDQYVDYPGDYHKESIESHFECSIKAYSRQITTSLTDALSEQLDMRELLKAEINSGCPAGFYYTNRNGGGHAVVIDGHTRQDGKDFFHANFGWFGRADGWYLLEEDLPPDTKEVAVITVVPKRSKAK